MKWEGEEGGDGGGGEGLHSGSWKHGYLKTHPQETVYFEGLL